jgi:hypothetical protein
MNFRENECTLQGTCIYREMVTSRYKNYCPPILVAFSGISDGFEIRLLGYIHMN